MKKRGLCFVMAAVFAAALVLTAAAADPAEMALPTEPAAPAEAVEPTEPSEPTDGPADEPADTPEETPAAEPTEEPVDEPAPDGVQAQPAAMDEPTAVAVEPTEYYDPVGKTTGTEEAEEVTDSETTWNKGWYVAKDTVTISGLVTVSGKVDLILADGCSLTVNGGIQVLTGNSLTIWGQSGGTGELYANGAGDTGGWSAGIGGDANNGVGAITINGGVITAIGGSQNAGIGSAIGFESITINGGNITASGHVGIGTKRADGIIGGPIEINGGTVTATGGGNNDSISVGIGGLVESVTITGGVVTATGGPANAGIGVRESGTITITGGTVNATGGKYIVDNSYGSGGAGISSAGGAITVTGGTVTAQGGPGGASHGGEGISGPVTVSGGKVTANGGNNDDGDIYAGITGSLSTGDSGNAVVYSNKITNKSGQRSWSGVVFEGDTGQVYGSPAVTESFAVQTGQTLTVPEGSILTVGEGATLTNEGTIENTGSIVKKGTITGGGRINGTPVDGYALTVTAPVFEKVKYGYAQPKAQAITIMNTGSNDVRISKVELTSGAEWFELAGPSDAVLSSGGSNTSWTIRPKAGLDNEDDTYSIYKATISVTYDFGCSATAEVSFTVDQADGTGTVTMADYACGETGVEPEVYSSTNTIWDDEYKAKGADDDAYSAVKPTTAGEYTVRITFDSNEHYESFALTADFTVRHRSDVSWELREDGGHGTCSGCGTELLLKADTLTGVPDGLEDEYPTLDALTRVLAQAVDTGEDYAVYDVKLERRTGGDWTAVPEQELPAGGIPVTLPYPAGTDAGYAFTVAHMFTSGERVGQVEEPTVQKGTDGLTFTLMGLSPVCVGWRSSAAAPSASPGPSAAPAAAPDTGDDTPLLPWAATVCLAGAALTALLLRRRRG